MFSLRYLEVASALLDQFIIDNQKLQKSELLFSNESVYVRFVFEIVEILESLLMVNKRNEKLFKGVEEFFNNNGRNIRPESLRNIFHKLYKYSYGTESSRKIIVSGERLLQKDPKTIEMKIFKEDMVNFEDNTFDFLLDLDEHQDNFANKSSFKFHRNDFNFYFLKFFMSKEGFKIMIRFLKGKSSVKDIVQKSIYGEKCELGQMQNYSSISGDLFLKILDLSFRCLLKLKSVYKSNSSVKFDDNFLKNFVKSNNETNMKETLLEKNIISETVTTEKALVSREQGFAEFYSTTLIGISEAGLQFLLNFGETQSFENKIEDVIKIVLYVEKIVEEIRKTKEGKQILEKLQANAGGKKLNGDFFVGMLITVIKIYLENPNYKQKMAVGSLLNNLEKYVWLVPQY